MRRQFLLPCRLIGGKTVVAGVETSDTSVGICGPTGLLPACKSQGIQVMNTREFLRVSVLGNLAVLRDGKRMQLPQSKKTRALLAYLAVSARPHTRDRLCAMF